MRIYRIFPLKSIQILLESQTQHKDTFPYKVYIIFHFCSAISWKKLRPSSPCLLYGIHCIFSTIQLMVSFILSSPPLPHNSTCRDVLLACGTLSFTICSGCFDLPKLKESKCHYWVSLQKNLKSWVIPSLCRRNDYLQNPGR